MNAQIRPPRADYDLSLAKAQLDEVGYCVVPDVLDAETVAALRERVEAQADAERALGLTPEDGPEGPNQRVFMLVNKGQPFVDLVTHPVAMALAGHILGSSFLLSQFSANIARLGGVEQGLHCDDWWGSPRAGPATKCPSPRNIGDLAALQRSKRPVGRTAGHSCHHPTLRDEFRLDDQRLHRRQRGHADRPEKPPLGPCAGWRSVPGQDRQQSPPRARPARCSCSTGACGTAPGAT